MLGRSWMQVWLLVLCLAGGSAMAAVAPFHAPAVTSGTIAVDLHATAAVNANTPVVASFGVPFPRGSITTPGLAQVRVLEGGNEIAAHVVALTPWRHRSNPGIDGQSLRVVLVQVEVSFANPMVPKRIEVVFGGAPRLLSRPTRATRATTWAPATTGSFGSSDNVFEPMVYATLPAAWLAQGVLRQTRSLPFDPSNGPVRDDPAAMKAMLAWPGTQEAERALKNNFYTVINEDDPMVAPANLCPYKTDFEPWLYDRPATMFTLYLRSGFVKPLREAVRHSEFYRARLNASGGFSLNPSDNKYSFNESLAYSYWLTGDETFLPAITSTANAHNGSNHTWSAGLGFWTERSVAFKLMAHLVDYEVNGTVGRRDSLNAMITTLAAHQNGVPAGIPASRIDGGWYHTGAQHGDWDGAAYGASTWMTALLTDALRRAYASAEDVATAHMIRRSGTFLRTALRTGTSQYGGTTLAPRYVIEHDGTDFAATGPLHDEEHSLDVVAALAWADYFGALVGQRDPLLAADIAGVYLSYDKGVNFWIRPTAPASGLSAFRISPWRKWGWEHHTSDGLSWALAGVSDSDAVYGNGFE